MYKLRLQIYEFIHDPPSNDIKDLQIFDHIMRSLNLWWPYFMLSLKVYLRSIILRIGFLNYQKPIKRSIVHLTLCLNIIKIEVRVFNIIIQLYSFLYPLLVKWRRKHLEILLLSDRPHGIGPKGPPSQKGHPHLGIMICHSLLMDIYILSFNV